MTKRLPSLEAYETWDGVKSAEPPGSLYNVGLLAGELLDTRYGGDQAKYGYWRALKGNTDWQTAFSNAFGISIEEFYRAFEEFRGTL